MPRSKRPDSRRRAPRGKRRTGETSRSESIAPDETPQPFLPAQMTGPAPGRPPKGRPRLTADDLRRRVRDLNVRPTIDIQKLLLAIHRINPEAAVPVKKLPEEIRESLAVLRPNRRSFHGTKLSLGYFPWPVVFSPCADKFGYMSSLSIRNTTKLPFTVTSQALLNQLGDLMGDPGRDTAPDSVIPAGFTYVGQFVDHDITFDVSSSLDTATDANTVNNMRTPALDLDSLYGRGPALDPFLYEFPSSGPSTAIKFQLGTNTNTGPGGPAGSAGTPAGMQTQTDFDVPRLAASSHTAIIGDPRNDENLIVVQFHQAMLRFHNQVVDLLVLAAFTGDIFIEAKRIVTHHYQWAVVHDFLERICGVAAVSSSLGSVTAAVNSPFRMPVEFAVAAYRFGHSMIRDNYWVNFNFPAATLQQVFAFNRNPNLPVLSNWVVDFNAFFETGIPVPVNNKARGIDSVLATQLEQLPGMVGLMAVLAKRNLRRGLALGLPSGQGMATFFGIPAMTETELTQGLPANEVNLLQSSGKILLTKTPLWYYVLREASVLGGGNQLGPVGARIVADTLVRILKRDPGSYLNHAGGFTPMLPSATLGDFTFVDLLIFAGVTQP